jgi:hypothetical protein
LLFESLVGSIVLAEKSGGFVVGAIELSDLGVGTVARDGDAFARIYWADKRGGRQCVVDVSRKYELWLSWPLPRLEWMEVALELSLR